MSSAEHTSAALQRALIAVRELRARLEASERAKTEPIAIVGMGCRFPGGANNPDAFWELLRNGVDAIAEVPAERWDSAALYDPDPSAPGRVSSRWGGFLDQIDRFDAAFFGIAPREANQMDPQQRLLLEVAWEALESAGQTVERLAGSATGVFVGVHSHSNDYTWLQFADPGQIDTYTGTGTSHSVVAGRLSYLLDLHGPSIALDTACSSSLVAVHLACQSLRNGECQLALAGGVNLALGPHFTMATTKMHMMAADGRCKTFDAAADGFVRGEGCGVVVLKRLSDALADGDPILAVIRGSAVNQDGRTNGLTAPSGLSQQLIVRQALRNAGVDPADIGAVEAHGTGTALGDPIEIEALIEVFGAAAESSQPIALSSVKTNIGHLEAAAGIAGLIKVVLSLQHEELPAHLHFQTLNPNSSLDGSRFYIPTTLREWRRSERRRYATVSSFGWSGTNGCLVVEEAPEAVAPPAAPEERVELLPISARSPQALRNLAESYRALLAGNPDLALYDLGYTASVRRSHHAFRLAVTGRSHAELADRLSALLQDGAWPFASNAVAPEAPAGPVFIFSGQGAQWAGMGRDLMAQEPVFAEMLRRCDELFRAYADWSLLDEIAADAAHSRLDRTEIAQPALFAVQVALAALWRSWGVEPEAVIGHSVGEVAAAHVAGVLSLEDAVRVAFYRGRVMQQAHGCGKMASVALPADEAALLIAPYGERLTIAAVNSPTSTVLAGAADALAEVVTTLTERGVFSRMLRVEYAFHSPQMEPFRDGLVQALRDITPQPARVPIISTVTGWPAAAQDFGAEYWSRNIRQPVQFAAALAQLGIESSTRIMIEISPQPVLARPIAEQLEQSGQTGIVLASMRAGAEARATLLTALGNLYSANYALDWQRLYPVAGRCVTLPSYPWQRERYWLQQQRPGVAPTLPVGSTQHPLLGWRVRSPLPTFENQLSSTTIAFLADHRIYGAALLPLTAYLELALAARTDGSPAQIVDLTLHETLILPDDEPRSIQVVLTPQGNQTAFQVFSQPLAGNQDEHDAAWTLHAAGKLQDAQQVALEWSDLKALQARLESVAVEPFYTQLRANGIEYGAAFTGIVELWRGENEALGRIELPEDLRAESSGYRCHPALLDACLQVLLAAVPNDQAEAYLPIGLDRFQPLGQPGMEVWSYARLRQTGAETAVADVEIHDADGNLVARIEGLLLKRADRRSVLRAAQTEPDLLYEVAWAPTTLERSAVPAEPGAWLIFADSSGYGKALVALLEARGEQAVLVASAHGAADGAGSLTLDLSQPEATARLLQQAQTSAGKPWRGIVHLWSLDAVTDEPTLDEIAAAHERSIRSVLQLVQALAESGAQTPRLWLVTRGAQAVAPGAPIAVAQAALWGLAKVVRREQPTLRCACIDLDPASDSPQVQLLHDLLLADAEDQIAIREGKLYVARLAPATRVQSATQQAPTQPIRLNVTERGVLEHLTFQPLARRVPGPGEVEIRVRATGLNFRDVLNALGMYPGDAGPLGLECAGEITAVGAGVREFVVGDAVLALAPASFGTFVTVAAQRVVAKPANLSFTEAATIPVAFLTAAYGLHHLAQIKAGDRVLIHAAAGGVGLAAVQLAQQAGAEVFATASPAKWPLLQQRGVRHIFNSRTLDFADQVRACTNGEGVDIVLNSLADEFIPQSIAILRAGGRFIEIGKRGIWDAAQVAQMRPDVHYHPFDLGVVADHDPTLIQAMFHDLMGMFAANRLAPLPQREFPLAQAVDAFRYMAQARHVGKIVVTQAERPTVRADATYLITGGLGALGLQVARWLVVQGARHLVLLGRSAPSAAAAAVLHELQHQAQIVTRQVDVADPTALAEVFAAIAAQMPPLRGVIHAAGVLDDGILQQQTWPRFERVLTPKVAGAWNLHQLTRQTPLDFFALFSSAASLLGSAGQSSYAAANMFLDMLAHYRRTQGLVATSINWGPWADGGMAASMSSQQQQRLTAQGFQSLTPEQGTQLLSQVIEAQAVQVGVLPIEWSAYLRQFGAQVPPFFARFAQRERQPESQPTTAPAQSGLHERLEAAHPGERLQLLQEYVQAQAIKILGLPPAQVFSPHQPLRELGLDSLMAVELKNALGLLVGQSLPSTLAFDYPTVAKLAEYLVRQLFPQDQAAPQDGAAESADQSDLVARVAALDEADVEALLAEKLAALDMRNNHE